MEDRLTAPLYRAAEIGRFLGMHPSRVRRWVWGYEFTRGSKVTRRPPIVRRKDPDAGEVSFLDLMELFFAQSFFEHGISPQRMRRAMAEAQALVGLDHPFARRDFYTEGKNIYLMLKQADAKGGSQLMHLLTGGQWAIAPVVLQNARQIDFGATGAAEKWYPMGRGQPIVVDPQVAFGAPVVQPGNVKTSVLYDLYLGERKNIDNVARYMGVDRFAVEAAVKWEETQLGKAA